MSYRHKFSMVKNTVGYELIHFHLHSFYCEKNFESIRDIFNDFNKKYHQDYDDFDLANEDDVLEEFLQIPRKTPKAAPVELDVVPAEAEKAEVGKLEGGDAPAEATSELMETDKIG